AALLHGLPQASGGTGWLHRERRTADRRAGTPGRALIRGAAAHGGSGRSRASRAHPLGSRGRARDGRDAGGASAGAAALVGARVPLGRARRDGADRFRRGASLMALPRKVAVIGAGDIGCGWAALCVAAGWPVTLFDASAQGLERAEAEVPQRARALVEQGRA